MTIFFLNYENNKDNKDNKGERYHLNGGFMIASLK
jgi:hypothetical protein